MVYIKYTNILLLKNLLLKYNKAIHLLLIKGYLLMELHININNLNLKNNLLNLMVELKYL